jgi:hypothetical protein
MSNYIKKPFKEVLSPESVVFLEELLRLKLFENAFAKGGWLAGGFPRALLLGTNMGEYFVRAVRYSAEFDPLVVKDRPLIHKAGDIDLFFPSPGLATSCSVAADEPGGRYIVENLQRFARNREVALNKYSESITVQFINDERFCYPAGPEQCLDNFDLINCKVAIDKENIIFHKDFFEVEKNKEVKIGNIESPFLAHRIYKYLTFRGLEKIHPDSFVMFDEWVKRASFQKFAGYDRGALRAISKVKELAELGLVHLYDIPLFLNKFSETRPDPNSPFGGYGAATISIDWALDYLNKNTKKPLRPAELVVERK